MRRVLPAMRSLLVASCSAQWRIWLCREDGKSFLQQEQDYFADSGLSLDILWA